MTMNIIQLLQNTFSQDQTLLKDAAVKLEAFANENFGNYLGSLCQEMVNDQNQSDVRYAAALAVKNTLTAKDQSRKEELIQRWFQTDVSIRGQVKAMSLQTLKSLDQKSAMSAAQVCAAIAEIELPRHEWPELMGILMTSVSSENINQKMASLKTIGYICESIDQDVLSTQANAILTAVAQGARKEESDEVRYVAIQALYNSLEFISVNFGNELERNYIMQVVCEGTQCANEEVIVASYQCLVRIMSLYYTLMPVYMEQALYNLTVTGMKNENQNIGLQAVEFWSTVCEVELDIEDENEYAVSEGSPLKENFHFASKALKEITPVLLWLLTKKEEDEDEDEWNVSMAAATCIQLLANVCQDEIVGHVIQFVESHIRHESWQFRDAAVMAFGSIMEGPSEKVLGPLCQSALKILCTMITDPVVSVKDTVSWTLGRLCEKLCDSISDADMPFVVQALVFGLSDSARVGANCAWAIMNLSDNFGSDQDPDTQTNMMSPYFDSLVTALMNAGEKAGSDNNYTASVYEAVASLVSNAPADCLPTVQKISTVVLQLLQKSVDVQAQLVGTDEKRSHIELQANLCSVLTSIIRRVKGEIAPVADGIMQLLLTIMSNASKTSTLLEDAFLTVGAITGAMETQFVRYMDSFMPFLLAALRNHEEHAMCSIAVGTIGDISRAINDGLVPYCDTLMTTLTENIQSPVLHRDVKPMIISCFGDIALAIGGNFDKYLNVVMSILNSAFASTATESLGDYELEDYFFALRESILEANVGIVQGLKASQKAYMINEHLVGMFAMLQEVFRDGQRGESISSTMVGLLGDLAEAYPAGQLKTFYQATWIESLIKEVRSNRHGSSASKEIARWAREMIKIQL